MCLVILIVDGSAASSYSTASLALLRRVGGDDATTFRSQVNAVVNLSLALGVAA